MTMCADLKKIWAIFIPAERRKARWMLALAALMASLETASVVSIAPFLSVLSRPGIIAENPRLYAIYERMGFDSTHHFIAALGFFSISFVLFSSAFKLVTQHLLNRFIHLERYSISARLLERYLHQPYEFFLAHNSAQLNKNILSEVDQLLFNLIQPLSQMLAQGFVIAAIALIIVLYDPLTAIGVLLVIGVMYALIYGVVRKRLGRIGRELITANSERYKASSEALGGIKEVKITHSIAAYLDKFKAAARLYSRHLAANDTLAATPQYIVEAIGYGGLIIIALLLLYRTSDAAHIMPALGLYGFAAYRLLPAAQTIYRGFARLKFSSAALDSIHRDLTLPNEKVGATIATLIPRKEIRLDHIRYAYPSAPDNAVLDDLNLTIPANTSVGIVGKSGAGKSTVMDLLLGLLQPYQGTLSVDDTPITSTNVADWQRAIGYVPQHIYLADASIAENIAFGVPREKIDMHAVRRAARAAQIADFIERELPNGYDSTVGDRGIRLSGGQRQRVGIARALYRDPPVLFMDEATSALDIQTEEALNEAVRTLSGNKTIIVVAHRLTSLKFCNKILTIGAKELDK